MAGCCDSVLRPIRGICTVILKIFWYCCRSPEQQPKETVYGTHSTTLLLSSNSDDEHHADNTKPSGPLIAFSYAGMLWAYYLGVIAFLRDHFDLVKSNIRLSGISCGTSAVLVIFLDLSIEQGFEFGLGWQKLFDDRPLKFWFLSTSQILNMILNKFHKFGIDDAVLADKYKKYGGANSIHFGVTALKMPNWRKFWKYHTFHLCLNDFASLKQLVYAGLCSMRTVPFFRTLGFYGGHYVLDGALTSNYSIPEIYRMHDLHKLDAKDQVIRIAVMKHESVAADIKPSSNFKWNEWIVSGDLEDNVARFNKGYRDAADFLNIMRCVRKGLVWSSSIDYNEINIDDNKEKWDAYIAEKVEQWNGKLRKYIADQTDEE
eukprot:CAMPEP_0197075092 /NCGR_PEP_ID=MMETSP1384-20130603/211436_1 /TAXON_ID=29189 /ORGANISM="Ammonia sp." /LENGTH=373 /DNA_ID=CAMNT_0042513935 /DNA_START=39 /DNA_END=1160 /DNA_ORIENTATION=-